MQIDQFLGAMNSRGATQAVITPGQPVRWLIDGQWQQGTTDVARALLNTMLHPVTPPSMRHHLADKADSMFEFEYLYANQTFQVRVATMLGERNVTITRSENSASPPASSPAFSLPPEPVILPPTGVSPSQNDPAQQAHAREGRPQNITQHIEPNTVRPVSPTPLAQLTPLAQPTPLQPVPPPTIAPPSIATPPPLGPQLPERQWYHGKAGEPIGPLTTAQMTAMIQQGVLLPETMVWNSQMPDWSQAKLTELEPAFAFRNSLSGNRERGYGSGGNDSGRGEFASIPSELEGFNWGAFLLPVFWAASHNLWGWAIGIFLSGWIPYLGWMLSLGLAVYLGIGGNELAWKYRRWNDLEHFKGVQHAWLRMGVIIIIASFVGAFLLVSVLISL